VSTAHRPPFTHHPHRPLAHLAVFPLNVPVTELKQRSLLRRLFSLIGTLKCCATQPAQHARIWLTACSLVFTLLGCTPPPRAPVTPPVTNDVSCVPAGTWVVPATGQRMTTPEIVSLAATRRIVLLGEGHTYPEHHLWQLEMIAALHGRRQHVVIGMEMFPRSTQAVLDQWVAGQLDEHRLLLDGAWKSFWRLPAELYLPILRYARMNRVPLRALNVPRELVSRVAAEGWDQVPEADRQGLSQPAPATPAYEKFLAETYRQHRDEPDVPDEAHLARFIAAQLVWDRAFAEGLRAAVAAQPDALVIGLMGSAHVKDGFGVPHQLASLGVDPKDVLVLLPWDASGECATLEPGAADAVFGIEIVEAASTPPRLGIVIAPADGGVAVKEVSPKSVAAAAGIRRGDVIVEAAGVALQAPGDLQEIVARQAPGTWLPLRVRRGKAKVEIVARFPAHPKPDGAQ